VRILKPSTQLNQHEFYLVEGYVNPRAVAGALARYGHQQPSVFHKRDLGRINLLALAANRKEHDGVAGWRHNNFFPSTPAPVNFFPGKAVLIRLDKNIGRLPAVC